MYISTSSGIGQAVADLPRVLRLNRYYARRLGWHAHFVRLAIAIGFKAPPTSEQAFAAAVARWQAAQTGLQVDGILGPKTWSRLRPVIGPLAAPAAPKGPVCEAARHEIQFLTEFLNELNEELKKTPQEVEKINELKGSILNVMDMLIDGLDDMIKSGCCEPQLKTLEAEVQNLPWPKSPPKDKLKELLDAIRAAQQKARKDFEHC